jgi:Transcription factor zinc-finger
VPDEKDRFGDKVRDVEKAREDQWAAQRDRELLENLRKKKAMDAASESSDTLCPRCRHQLVKTEHGGVSLMTCPEDGGAWLDKSDLNQLLQRLK